MSRGHGYGVAIGFAVTPIVYGALGYTAPDLNLLPGWGPWLWIAAPVVTWVGAETVARVWRRARLVGQILALVVVAGAAAWWWWAHGVLIWGGASPLVGAAVPTGLVGVCLLAAVMSGRSE